jgi:hypothetical protein
VGFAEDVVIATELDSCAAVPFLSDGAFGAASASTWTRSRSSTRNGRSGPHIARDARAELEAAALYPEIVVV